tara:strand:+ start:216 stop:494 length:279 start_codon:yes stop_codon:yes gene_type:complete
MDETLKADGYDEAIMGYAGRCGMNEVLLYSTNKIIQILMERDGMTDEEAIEFFEFNIKGAYMGEGTPLYYDDLHENTRDYRREDSPAQAPCR